MQGGVSMSSRNCVIIQREKRVVGWAAAPRDYAWYIKSYSSQVIIWWMRWHLWLIFSFFPCVCPTFIHARWSGWCPVTLSPQTMGWWDYRTPEKKKWNETRVMMNSSKKEKKLPAWGHWLLTQHQLVYFSWGNRNQQCVAMSSRAFIKFRLQISYVTGSRTQSKKSSTFDWKVYVTVQSSESSMTRNWFLHNHLQVTCWVTWNRQCL
jgi:hypothetical protein